MKTCPNCKSKVNDDTLFCSVCGFYFEEGTLKNNASSGKNPLKGLLIVLVVILIILSMAVGGFIWWNHPAKRVQRLLDLGQKYLAELDYDQSIITLEKALRIDPKNSLLYSNLAEVYVVKADHISEEEKLNLYETANENYEYAMYYAGEDDARLVKTINEFYLNWAQIYIDLKDYEMAKNILNQGFEITEQDELKSELEEVENQEKSEAKTDEGNNRKSNQLLYNENARAIIIDVFQVYQPKSFDTVYTGPGRNGSYHTNCNYTYDETGTLPITVVLDNKTERTIKYQYDINGYPNYMELHELADDYSEEYFYDNEARLTNSVYHNLHEPQDPINYKHEYDEGGIYQGVTVTTQVQYPFSYKYEYDEKNRIKTELYEDEWYKISTSYEYDEQNRIIKETESSIRDQYQYTTVTTYNY
ncbi:Tetratricopeptide repeat-containing protein [Oribacterium sp. KHPX15]|uniref:hypothetical protein n=1 Tax=unclassified Oribacterium TaxID=2629782 RepID=UPI0004E22189|nr:MULTISPECIES: hypothetical protein [unclassified Oribacterium]SDZ96775.1 Tetratricopeptide repeat-containing protein [Oribacterium sp. KHPX15]